METLVIRSPTDFHVHLRQGELCKAVVPDIRKGGVHSVYVMPNLQPPITTTGQAIAYKKELEAIDPRVEYMMTLYLSPSLTPHEIRKAKKAGIVGVKSYPRGVTTNSESGIEDYAAYYPVFDAMQTEGLVLNLHGEVPSDPSSNTCILNAEEKFLPQLAKLHATFPKLKIVLEHATTQASIEMVKSLGDTVGCTITAHHLALTVDDWAGQSLHYCKPVAKLPADRESLRDIIRSGHPRFFLGSDSAPHPSAAKTTTTASRGCAAGIYTAPILLPLLAHLLESFGALEKLEAFVSIHGRQFYGLPLSQSSETVTLQKTSLEVDMIQSDVIPFWVGKTIGWKIMETER